MHFYHFTLINLFHCWNWKHRTLLKSIFVGYLDIIEYQETNKWVAAAKETLSTDIEKCSIPFSDFKTILNNKLQNEWDQCMNNKLYEHYSG